MRLRIVRNEFLECSEAPLREIVPLSLVTEQCTAPTVKEVAIVPEESHDNKSEKVIIRKNGIKIELPQSTEDHMLRGLKEC